MFGAPNFFFSGAKKATTYYRVIQQFNSTSSWTAPTGVTSVDYLVVAGGGGGGTSIAIGAGCGGGGAGGYLAGTSLTVTPGTSYPITVGGGGTAGVAGTNSLLGNLVNSSTGAVGGGFDEMYKTQNGKCLICGVTESCLGHRLAVDHCHTTGKIRGLLCKSCNTAIGNFKDNIDNLKNAIIYLEKSNK